MVTSYILHNEKRRNCGNSSLALLAEGVREIMFSDTVELSIDGKKQTQPPCSGSG